MVNLDETMTNAAIGLIVSLCGTYLIAMRTGAAMLDTGLRKEITEKESALKDRGEEIRKLQERLAPPHDEGHVKSELKSYSAGEKRFLKWMLLNGGERFRRDQIRSRMPADIQFMTDCVEKAYASGFADRDYERWGSGTVEWCKMTERYRNIILNEIASE